MSEKIKKSDMLRRYLLFIISLFLVALGISIAVKANLGISPISSPAYVISLFLPIPLGYVLFLWNMVLLLAQIIILKKDFQYIQLMQIPLSLIFGWFANFTGRILSIGITPNNYTIKLIYTITGIFITALGITLSIIANVVLNSGEGFVKAVADKLNKKFGNVKIAFDISCSTLTVAISLLFSHEVLGVREGTLIAAVFTGIIVKFLTKFIRKPVCKLFVIKNEN